MAKADDEDGEGGSATTHGAENAPEATVDADQAERRKHGFLFTWCFRCCRIDVAQYGIRPLPDWLGEGSGIQLDSGFAIITCGICKGGGKWGDRFGNVSWSDESKKRKDKGSAFEKLRISPVIFSECEVVKVARAITSSEVAFIADKGRVGYRNIDKIVTG